MANSDPAEFTQWLVREWAERFQLSAEAMSGEAIQVESSPVDWEAAGGDLLWNQPFDLGPGADVQILAPRTTWLGLGARVLAAAGIDEAEEADSRATFVEILQQSLSSVATSIGAALGRKVSTTGGQATQPPPGLVPDGWFRVSVGAGVMLGPVGVVVTQAMRVAPPEGGRATATVGGAPASQGEAGAIAGPTGAVTGAGVGQSAPGQGGTGTGRGHGGAIAPSVGDQGGEQASAGSRSGTAGAGQTMELLYDVELPVAVSFGRAHLPLKEVVKLTSGSIVELNRAVAEPVELIVNNCVIARAEVVVVDGNYGVRILEIISQRERLRTLH